MMKKFLKDLIEVVLISAILVFVVLKYVFIPCKVDGLSMYPTLDDGDYGYSFVITRNIGIERFDIAVIRTEERLLVKRVIGLPGEKIVYSNNILYVNDVACEEDFLSDVYTDDLEIILGEDEYFCLGDNREVSRDSRYYGPFSSSEIVSTHYFVLYPFARFGEKK